MSSNFPKNHKNLFQKSVDAVNQSTYSIGYKGNDERMLGNEEVMKLDNESITKLLLGLIDHPYLISFIEQDWADELERLNLFSLDEFAVTAAGRDFLATHPLTV
jgi:hypothetical protein